MKYAFGPRAMWAVFSITFERELHRMRDVESVMERSAVRYREILKPIPEFESGDRFLINIRSAAMLSAVYLELPEKPDVTDGGLLC